MNADETGTCAMCGDPIDADQASMISGDGRVAHSGCVYGADDIGERDRWMPPE